MAVLSSDLFQELLSACPRPYFQRYFDSSAVDAIRVADLLFGPACVHYRSFEAQSMRLDAKRIATITVFLLICGTAVHFSKLVLAPRVERASPGQTPDSEAAPASVTNAASTVREFQVGKDGRLLFLMGKVNGMPVRFLVDTGSSRTGLDSSFRPFLGNPVGTRTMGTPAGPVQLETFNRPDIQIGDLNVTSSEPIFCHDFRELAAATGVDYAGVIGIDVLKQYVVQINFDKGLLRLLAELPRPVQELGTAFRLSYHQGVPFLLASAGSIQAEFVIDTGSTNTCIASEMFAALAANREVNTGSALSVMTAAGQLRTKAGLLHTLILGNYVHRDVLCDIDIRNMLGLRYLSRYLVTFDFREDLVYFREGQKYSKLDARGISGIRPESNDAGFLIRTVAPDGPAAIAGIQVDDQITEIDGESAAGMDMFRFGELLTGTPGREVNIKLQRGGREIRTSLVIRDRFR